jgi:two-component system, OmpR family, sensor histidine kinase BaeS
VTRFPPRNSVAARLVVAFALVAGVAVLTAGVVGTLVAPPLFHHHLHEALPAVTTDVLVHADNAFASANALSLAVALLAGLTASVAASGYLAHRLTRSLRPLATAAEQLAAGQYSARVGGRSLGGELDQVTVAFDDMAARLQRTEATRRRLFADLAHELRTPVATLTAYLEGLEDGVTTLDGDTGDVMRAQLSRLARLAEDMTAVSRAEEGHLSLDREAVDPAELLRSAAGAVRERCAGGDVGLRTVVAPGLPRVAVDRHRMAQVLANLLDNAVRHTPAGGTVTLAADGDGDADTVSIRVSDTGCGIAAEHLPHVFERFYRVEAARDRLTGGSGIGLSITKALVDAHGGHVTAASDGPGRGATFTVTLPGVA